MKKHTIPDFPGGSPAKEKEYLEFIIHAYDAPLMLIKGSLKADALQYMESFALHYPPYYSKISELCKGDEELVLQRSRKSKS